MPKAKPDQVVVHRIELQEKEREMLEAYVGGTVVKNAVVPLSIAAGVGTAGYLAYKSLKAAYGWTEDIVEDIKRTPFVRAASITPQGRAARGLGKVVSFLFTPQE
jgi:hypothetical protein